MGEVKHLQPEKRDLIPMKMTERGVLFQAYTEDEEVAQTEVTLLELIESGNAAGLQAFQTNSMLFTILQQMVTDAKATRDALAALTGEVKAITDAQREAVERVQSVNPMEEVLKNPQVREMMEKAGLAQE